MGLNALLRTLKASGVRHYVADKGRVEVQFWPPADGEEREVGEPLEGEAMHAAASGPVYKDPLRVALNDKDFPPLPDESDPDVEAAN